MAAPTREAFGDRVGRLRKLTFSNAIRVGDLVFACRASPVSTQLVASLFLPEALPNSVCSNG
jgi:hypothetical protein